MRLYHRKSGFTLLELVVSIAILSILAGIAVPNYISYLPKARLKGAANTVLVDLMAARMKAIKLKSLTKMFFLDDHQYKICAVADSSATVDDCVGEVFLRDIAAEFTGVTLSANFVPLFNPRGTASNLGKVTVTNPSGTKYLTVSITGIVRLS